MKGLYCYVTVSFVFLLCAMKLSLKFLVTVFMLITTILGSIVVMSGIVLIVDNKLLTI